jgi:hypothetical protein
MYGRLGRMITDQVYDEQVPPETSTIFINSQRELGAL